MSIPTNPAEPDMRKIAMQVYGDHIALVDHWTGSHVARLPLERMAEAKAFVAALEGAQAKPADRRERVKAMMAEAAADPEHQRAMDEAVEDGRRAAQPAEVPALTDEQIDAVAQALFELPVYTRRIELRKVVRAALAPQLAPEEK